MCYAVKNRSKYHINRMAVNNEYVSAFMAYAVMNIDDSGYYSFQELNDSVYLFPFDYHVGNYCLDDMTDFQIWVHLVGSLY